MRIKALLFDLDNTLYDEKEFVKSGFQTVSKYMTAKYRVDEESFYRLLLSILEEHGRGKVFDIALETLNVYKKETVQEMVKIYRSHSPNISLFSEASETLSSLKTKYRIGLLTDGVREVQENKIGALKIGDFFDAIIYAVEHGGKNVQAFQTTLKELRVKPTECIYVDDDPKNAFEVANKLGIYTVQILRNKNRDFKMVGKQNISRFKIMALNQLLDVINAVQNAAKQRKGSCR